MKQSGFAAYLQEEIMADIPGITFRKMFGGYGIYKGGIICALILHDILYFKVDESNKGYYEKLGSKPFVYINKKGNEVVMPYYEVPERYVDNKEKIEELVTASYHVGLRQKQQTY